jgi:chaperone modulatory protein CbpM
MLDLRQFLVTTGLDDDVLRAWIEAGWLKPVREAAGWRFSEIDLARLQLIRDLRDDLGINDEGVGIALDLIDQVHGLRRILRNVLAAASAQPEPARRRMAGALRASAGPRPSGQAQPPSQD